MDEKALLHQINILLLEETVRGREYGAEFRTLWNTLFDRVTEHPRTYPPKSGDSTLALPFSFAGIETTFHFDQLKMDEWFRRDINQRRPVVFKAEKLKRDASGVLTFHDSLCSYNGKAPERALTEDNKNIFACALPGLPPRLGIVYGNKWVDSRFTALRRHTLQLYLIQTDYAPAFLQSDLEVCLYLFLMDYCIIRENTGKVKDTELRPFLHVFRPSPMLQVKGLLEPVGDQ